MASLFLYHVVGDLTVGKPELSEFWETETVAAAIRCLGDTSGGGIPVWRKRNGSTAAESAESRQQRFVGILNTLDIVAFLARDECLADQDKALSTPVSHVIVPATSALKIVDPGTRLIDALEMMKQGVKRLLVPKSLTWRGISKRFSILYNGKWLKNSSSSSSSSSSSQHPTSCVQDRFCCLSREDVLRFLIGCLGALAPLPLSSIASVGAVSRRYCSARASARAAAAAALLPREPCAVAVTVAGPAGGERIVGEISSARLWRCDCLAAAWALANLTAGHFVMGVQDDDDDSNNSNNNNNNNSEGMKEHNFNANNNSSPPLTCRETSSVAAVMAQMLSHRATHVWVTRGSDDVLVGVVGYADILAAVTAQPGPPLPDGGVIDII